MGFDTIEINLVFQLELNYFANIANKSGETKLSLTTRPYRVSWKMHSSLFEWYLRLKKS